MYRVWFCDLERAIAAFREKVKTDLFCSIVGNAYGDFVFHIDENKEYIVKHNDFSVWELKNGWKDGKWVQL